mmetsp:Transcript_10651/g.20662  ORF Transcript_10651/g.20662 Transcript_10651/m.20662 type:complete len:216 (+) Transcript_10651:309-956(+)
MSSTATFASAVVWTESSNTLALPSGALSPAAPCDTCNGHPLRGATAGFIGSLTSCAISALAAVSHLPFCMLSFESWECPTLALAWFEIFFRDFCCTSHEFDGFDETTLKRCSKRQTVQTWRTFRLAAWGLSATSERATCGLCGRQLCCGCPTSVTGTFLVRQLFEANLTGITSSKKTSVFSCFALSSHAFCLGRNRRFRRRPSTFTWQFFPGTYT